MSFPDFVAALQTPNLIAVVVGALWSVIVEYFPAWTTLDPKWKRAVFFGLSLLVPVLGAAIGISAGYQVSEWESTWWPCVLAGLVAFTSGQIVHMRKM